VLIERGTGSLLAWLPRLRPKFASITGGFIRTSRIWTKKFGKRGKDTNLFANFHTTAQEGEEDDSNPSYVRAGKAK
jgi:hypothetical protein